MIDLDIYPHRLPRHRVYHWRLRLSHIAGANPFVLHGTNLAGAALLTISLLVHTNWPSLVLEGFWAAIALVGITKAIRTGRKGQEREA